MRIRDVIEKRKIKSAYLYLIVMLNLLNISLKEYIDRSADVGAFIFLLQYKSYIISKKRTLEV